MEHWFHGIRCYSLVYPHINLVCFLPTSQITGCGNAVVHFRSTSKRSKKPQSTWWVLHMSVYLSNTRMTATLYIPYACLFLPYHLPRKHCLVCVSVGRWMILKKGGKGQCMTLKSRGFWETPLCRSSCSRCRGIPRPLESEYQSRLCVVPAHHM